MMPFRVAIPNKVINPTSEAIDNVPPETNTMITPPHERGRDCGNLPSALSGAALRAARATRDGKLAIGAHWRRDHGIRLRRHVVDRLTGWIYYLIWNRHSKRHHAGHPLSTPGTTGKCSVPAIHNSRFAGKAQPHFDDSDRHRSRSYPACAWCWTA